MLLLIIKTFKYNDNTAKSFDISSNQLECSI